MPDTCEPTLTVTNAETSPVALTVSLTVPRVTGSVRKAAAGFFPQAAAAATPTSAEINRNCVPFDLMSASFRGDVDDRRSAVWRAGQRIVWIGEDVRPS